VDLPNDTTRTPHVLLIVADGVRPDLLADEVQRGRTPSVSALVARGGLHTVSTAFPSVTGPAYVPFLMGRHPATAGLPGLRWFDRARSLRWSARQARSYAGIDIWHVDHDVHAQHPTLLELARPSLSAMSMLARGATHGRIGRSIAWMLRAAPSHFRGDILGWRRVEQAATAHFFRRFAAVRPRFAVLAIASPDKFAHAFGHDADPVREVIGDIDRAIATAHAIAARDQWDGPLHVWIVGDHGHAPVSQHDDLHGWLEDEGWRVMAHPSLKTRRADLALMVGGNAMAHLYAHPHQRTRSWWGTHGTRWDALADALIQRPSVDLMAMAHDAQRVEVRHAARGRAWIRDSTPRDTPWHDRRWEYEPIDGDPLRLGGGHRALDAHDAWQLCATSPYPDAIVQLSILTTAERAGDVIVSASEGWDLRARFEPVTHVSTHGALLREQMHVPLVLDVPVERPPQRTTDVVPSALDLLGITTAAEFDGQSFLRQR